MIRRSPGCRSNTPVATIRSTCRPASACQPQAPVASLAATAGGSPPYSTSRRAADGGAGCRYRGTSRRSKQSSSGANLASSRNAPLEPRVLLTRPPAKPRSPVARSSSSAAAYGSAVGSVAKPASRPGFARTAAASRSLASRARASASAPSSACAAGATCEMTWRSMPLASMSASRPAPRSRSRSSICWPHTAVRPESATAARPAVQKCSSSAIVRTRIFSRTGRAV